MKSKIFLMIFIAAVLNAQNANDALRLSEPGILSNARALGMGNSYVALSNDVYGLYSNPAGLGTIRRFQFAGGLSFGANSNSAEFFNRSIDYSSSSNNFNQIGFAYPFPTYRGSFVIGFAYNKTKDFNNAIEFDGFNSGNNSLIQELASVNDDLAYFLGLSYESPVTGNDETLINGNLNQSGLILEEGGLNHWSFSGAVEIARGLFLGGGFNVVSGIYKRDREYFEDDSRNNYTGMLDPSEPVTTDFKTFFLNDIIDWEVTGWDMKFGMLFNPNRNTSIGASVKLPTVYTISEEYYIDASSYFKNDDGYDYSYDEKIEYDISTPMELNAGGSFKVAGLTVAGQINYIDYTQMEFTEGLNAAQRSNNNKDIMSMFRGTLGYNFGIEYKIPFINSSVRGGYFTLPSPFKDDPSSYNKQFFTLGAGFTANRILTIDAAYAFGWWDTHGDNYGSDVSRTLQSITRSSFLINVTYGL